MANKTIQLSDGTNNLYPVSYAEDKTVTTGTTQYSGYYYADGTMTSGAKGISIVNVTSNRPAFAILLTTTSFRVFSPVASTAVTVRIIY